MSFWSFPTLALKKTSFFGFLVCRISQTAMMDFRFYFLFTLVVLFLKFEQALLNFGFPCVMLDYSAMLVCSFRVLICTRMLRNLADRCTFNKHDSVCSSYIPCSNCAFNFSPLFVTWKKVVNGGEPRLRGCIGTLEARGIVNGFKDYALTRWIKLNVFLLYM